MINSVNHDEQPIIPCHAMKVRTMEGDPDGEWLVVLEGVKRGEAREVWRLFQKKYGDDQMLSEEQVSDFSGSLAFRMPRDFTQEMTAEVAERFSAVINDAAETVPKLKRLKKSA